MDALEYISQVGIPDDTCENYEGKEGVCDAIGICRDCGPGNVSAGEVNHLHFGCTRNVHYRISWMGIALPSTIFRCIDWRHMVISEEMMKRRGCIR